MLEEKRKQDEIRIQEEMQLLQDLKGNFASMITNIYNSETRLELPLTGVKLEPVQYRIIFKALELNNSIKLLNIDRRQLADEEAIELFKALQYNTCLERVDLENNNLGPKFLEGMAICLGKNQTLRSVDLEGNN